VSEGDGKRVKEKRFWRREGQCGALKEVAALHSAEPSQEFSITAEMEFE